MNPLLGALLVIVAAEAFGQSGGNITNSVGSASAVGMGGAGGLGGNASSIGQGGPVDLAGSVTAGMQVHSAVMQTPGEVMVDPATVVQAA